ncbi:hypothetical protein AY608_09750 [Acinetobacter terrae]|nr:hypothetical protein AY608_09750 [Acinetobacter terrae]
MQDFCAMVALILLTATQFIKKNIQINKNTFYLFLFILSIPIIQFLFNILFFKQELFLSILYISIFFLSIIYGINQKEASNRIIKVSFFFVSVGIVCVFIQIIQWTNIYYSPFILESNYLRPSANLGQPNNLATLLFICLFSNLYIFKNKKINTSFYISINIFIIFGIALTQSRTSWIVFIALLILSHFKKELKLFKTIMINSILFFILVLITPYITLFYHGKGLTIIERINSDYSRLSIWKQIIIAITNKPLTGYGWNQTSVAQTQISLKYPIKVWLEYSHNMFLDILVWTGIPIGLLIITLINKWLFKTYQNIKNTNQLIIFFIIISFFIHCMFEFPFAYAYFLIPVGIYIGFLNKQDYNIITINIFTILLFLLISTLLTIITIDYMVLSEKRNNYSTKYLFSKKISPLESNIKILDALDLHNDILFLNDCYILKNKSIKNIKHIFYRYPTNKNIVIYYRFSLYYKNSSKEVIEYMKLKYPNFDSNQSKYNMCN